MVGIYKITNNINQNCYIGQSTQIEKRWSNHKIASSNLNDKSYDYPLYRAFRKYGIENFTFEVLEECSNEELNDKEIYWIKYFKPVYNQTTGGNFQIVPQKLTYEQVKEIQEILLKDIDGQVSHKELAKKYNVEYYTIQDINAGRTWHNAEYEYPLHLSKYDNRRIKKKNYCCDCGKEIFRTSIRCNECEGKRRIKVASNKLPVTREELKELIRSKPFTQIGNKYGVTDNAIRKWCDKFNLPRKKSDINKYSDEEWQQI